MLRAFTTTHVAFRRGASEILLAREVDEARELAEAHPQHLLAGERNARRVEGFDAGNSPADFGTLELRDRGVVLTTTNGVRATTHAAEDGDVVVTGWSNVPATLLYLRGALERGIEHLALIASHPVSDEDVACADYIEAGLTGKETPTPATVLHRIRRARSAQKFQVTDDWSDDDLHLASQRHPPRFAMVVEMRQGRPVVVKERVENGE